MHNFIELIETIKSGTVDSDRFRFFNIECNIQFDSSHICHYYRSTYRHFKPNSPKDSNEDVDTYYIISNNPILKKPTVIVETEQVPDLLEIFSMGSNQHRFKIKKNVNYIGNSFNAVTDTFLSDESDEPSMLVDKKVCIILDPELWQSYSELIIVNCILSQISDHCVLHAGVVTWKNKGFIFCGNADSGKTSLTLTLVQEGFKFLSDELALIDMFSGEVNQFPRFIGLRENTLERFPKLKKLIGEQNARSLSGDKKWALDIEKICPDSLGGPSKVDYLIFLSGFAESPKLTPILKSEALFETLKCSHAAEKDTFKHLLNMTNFVRQVECYRLILGKEQENAKILKKLTEKK